MTNSRKKLLYSIAFILPAMILVVFISIIPTIQNFYYSFYEWDILEPDMTFVGLQNYAEFWTTEGMQVAVSNTIIYAFLAAIFKNLVGLSFALIFTMGFRTQNFLRTCILSTTMISLVISGFTWSYLYHPQYGIGFILENTLGLSIFNQDYLGNPNIALYSVLFVSIWQIAGKYMVIYLAGLQTVPQDLYEACDIDGASPWQKLKNITFPLIIPSFTVGILNALIQGFKVFDEIYSMTKGGPGFATETLTSLMYSQTFTYTGRAGMGSAISGILFVIVLGTSIVVSSYLRKREDNTLG